MKTLDEFYGDDELTHEDTIDVKKKSLLATLNREKISKYEMDELFA